MTLAISEIENMGKIFFLNCTIQKQMHKFVIHIVVVDFEYIHYLAKVNTAITFEILIFFFCS